jgi:hypothetical protein
MTDGDSLHWTAFKIQKLYYLLINCHSPNSIEVYGHSDYDNTELIWYLSFRVKQNL